MYNKYYFNHLFLNKALPFSTSVKVLSDMRFYIAISTALLLENL